MPGSNGHVFKDTPLQRSWHIISYGIDADVNFHHQFLTFTSNIEIGKTNAGQLNSKPVSTVQWFYPAVAVDHV